MPVNGLSVGIDYTLSYYDSTSKAVVDLGDVQNVKISAPKHNVESRPYNGKVKMGYIPDGYRFTFTIVRTGPELESYQLTQDANFYNGVPTTGGYMNETVTEGDGSVSRYQYTDFVFAVTEVAELSREGTIRLQCEGFASDKVPLA